MLINSLKRESVRATGCWQEVSAEQTLDLNPAAAWMQAVYPASWQRWAACWTKRKANPVGQRLPHTTVQVHIYVYPELIRSSCVVFLNLLLFQLCLYPRHDQRGESEGWPEVLLHEPVWEVQGPSTQTLEDGSADPQNCHDHHPGTACTSPRHLKPSLHAADY